MRYPRKLTDDQVTTMRMEYARGYKSSYRLASEHGITQAAVVGVVQGSTYKHAGGPITWPRNQKPLTGFSDSRVAGRVRPRQRPPDGKNHGQCWDVACKNQIASSGWAQRMHFCESCFRINGGKKGRGKTGKTVNMTCRVCRRSFVRYITPQQPRPKTCSAQCGIALSADKRRKRPRDMTNERLYELYWGQNLTTMEIASQCGGDFTPDAVLLWLHAAGIPARRPTCRTYTSCVVDGCDQVIKKLWNGHRWYGRLCVEHLRERDARRRHYYETQVAEQRGSDLSNSVKRLLAGLPDSVKSDAEQEIIIAVLSGEMTVITNHTVKPYIARVFRENADAYKFVSLAAPTQAGDDAQTWGDRLGLT